MESEPLSIDHQNFHLWHSRILKDLYKDEHAGFPIMMIALPLLERYLREKSGTREDLCLNKQFYLLLIELFPELTNDQVARDFWKVYRHGLLHQVSMMAGKTKDSRYLHGWLGKINGPVSVDKAAGRSVFHVDPVQFATKVVETIDSDFKTFIGPNSPNHSLAKGQIMLTSSGATGAPGYGTSGTSRPGAYGSYGKSGT